MVPPPTSYTLVYIMLVYIIIGFACRWNWDRVSLPLEEETSPTEISTTFLSRKRKKRETEVARNILLA